MRWRRSDSTFSATSVSSSGLTPWPLSDSQMIGCALTSCLATIGSSASRGQLAAHARDAVAHVVGGFVDVAAQVELDRDARHLLLRGRGDELDALDGRELLFEHVGDLGLDHLGAGAAVDRGDRDDRRVDVRVLAHRQEREREQAEQQQRQAHHRGEDRPLDRDLAELHWSLGLVGVRMGRARGLLLGG